MKTLQDAKRDVSARFVGKAGIHGVSSRASENVVYVYVDRGVALMPSVRDELMKLAAPYPVVTQEESRAVLLPNLLRNLVSSLAS